MMSKGIFTTMHVSVYVFNIGCCRTSPDPSRPQDRATPASHGSTRCLDGRETPSLCCKNGKVRLCPLPSSPDPLLLDLVRGDTELPKSFLPNIWRVNPACSFTFTGAGCGSPLNQQRFAGGPSTFVTQRAFHHYLSSPLPRVGERHEGSDNSRHQPQHAKIYFYST